MKALHFYVDKSVSFLFFTFSVVLVVGIFLIGKERTDFNNNILESCVMIALFALFAYGSVFYFFLMFRKKSLLTITNEHLIIYNVFKSSNTIDIENINSFSIVNNNYKGIATTKEIYIELKIPSRKFRRYWINRFLANFSTKLASSEYSIHTNLLKVKQGDLLEILNERLRIMQQKRPEI